MQCSKCHTENPEANNFCRSCGEKLLLTCPQCDSEYLPEDQFCGKCGHKIKTASVRGFSTSEAKPIPVSDSERKHITVLFSDLSGYTAITEKLDPEETKDIMARIFGEISKVVSKYEGFIEKFVGDAVMVLFGFPTAHEDDPVRAIKARDIHEIVSSLSPRYERLIGKPLAMHTGICTGLVLTGEVNLEKGTYGVLGDTINTASRLSGLAKPDEILVGSDTYYQAEGYFTFEPLEHAQVKGKAEPVKPYKLLSPREEPIKTRRLSGLRAELIGRRAEITILNEAIGKLKQGKGSIISISGDAGTGKSRLIEEFRTTPHAQEIQWREAHCYAYAQNIPYFPLLDLFSRAWQIKEGDSSELVRNKVESRIKYLLGNEEEVIPYIGTLYSLSYPEIEEISPELWKSKLYAGVQSILSALARKAPTVICLEDLHWSDTSSIELLRFILKDFQLPAVFICAYRPPFSLFASSKLTGLSKAYHEIKLQDLSTSEAQIMVVSLLKTEAIPSDLRRFIQTRVEGNPFYLEEIINALVESETLVRENGSWKLTRSLLEVNMPSTVQGIISARLDRLERATKRILQEASVIGRAFLYDILERVTELKEHIDRSLTALERLDLIRTVSLQPHREYVFKHALTQEVVYNGILRKERPAVHEKIGLVMEDIFHDRLPEFYETLAFHFKQGQSVVKAVDYLMKAGDKSMHRYALDESHQYYKEAFELLSGKLEASKGKKVILIDLILNWTVVYIHRGAISELYDLLKDHEELALSLDDKARLGMFYVRLGWSMELMQKIREAYQCLHKALALGEQIGDEKVIGYACGWLTFVCGDLGLLDDAVAFGQRVQAMPLHNLDQELFRLSTTGLGIISYFKGDIKTSNYMAQALIDFGRKHSNMPCLAEGYLILGFGYLPVGDFSSAIECAQKAIQSALEPLFYINAKLLLGLSYLSNGQHQEAEDSLQEVIKLTESYGLGYHGVSAKGCLGIAMVAKGHLYQGIRMVEDVIQAYIENENKYRYAFFNFLLGKVYLQILRGGEKKNILFLVKNIGFLIRTVPFAHKKAEDHLNKAVEVAKEIGAKNILGQAYFNLGQLHKFKGKTDKARECISEAISAFEECEADVFLKQAHTALNELT
jgi:class 3 adenylate cyclase/tetratricopeptide (TPR) repeat protein